MTASRGRFPVLLASMLQVCVASAQVVCMESKDIDGPVPNSNARFKMTLDSAQSSLHGEITFHNLSGVPTVAYLYCCSAAAPTQKAVALAYTFTAPDGGLDAVYPLAADTAWDSGFLTLHQNAQGSLQALLNGLRNKQVFGAIATAALPNGEIVGVLDLVSVHCP